MFYYDKEAVTAHIRLDKLDTTAEAVGRALETALVDPAAVARFRPDNQIELVVEVDGIEWTSTIWNDHERCLELVYIQAHEEEYLALDAEGRREFVLLGHLGGRFAPVVFGYVFRELEGRAFRFEPRAAAERHY